ncbi:hypothetical protein HJC23_010147 [Cyclotella cryptica]|uniref:Uncharacterized protein n=1 Tax=Cyclotella cryptica TaxID=29204 RepID=A0ABD3NU59_9STRA|eukprot:CCRYP_020302-RA/>CCRYP_020302-RA protein AED:0.18 eAED:-0.08 QI:0/-1/0/1/-1/1/1/0/137
MASTLVPYNDSVVKIDVPTHIHFHFAFDNIADNLRGFHEEEEDMADIGDVHRILKWNAAQKRQDQRDRRRKWTNPDRTQEEELRERWRKHYQGANRGNSRVDPYEPIHGGADYVRHRENGKNWKKLHPNNPHVYGSN